MSELQIMTNPKNPRGQLLNLREAAGSHGQMSESHCLQPASYDGKGPPALKLPGTNRWHFWANELDAQLRVMA